MKWNMYGDDVLPLWVADSDFKCAKPITDALHKAVEHGVYGYHKPEMNHAANTAVKAWLKRRHQWLIEDEWLVWLPGVVSAFNVACQAYSKPGDKVLVQLPNYKPLRLCPGINQRQLASVGTVEESGRWTLDFEELEQKASDPACTLFLLCNPMNPCGTVLTQSELEKIETICLQHNVTLCSDEIHCDLVLSEAEKHFTAGRLETIGEQSIVIMAANKTFNVAGLSCAFAIIPDKKQRQVFARTAMGVVPWANHMGVLATEVAFTQCDEWYQAQLKYLRQNQQYLAQEINNITGLSYQPAAATFLAWVDASGLEVEDAQAYCLARNVAPSAGEDFGWKNYIRINFACPNSLLVEAISRLKGE